jgi:hypothetical protein
MDGLLFFVFVYTYICKIPFAVAICWQDVAENGNAQIGTGIRATVPVLLSVNLVITFFPFDHKIYTPKEKILSAAPPELLSGTYFNFRF